MLHAADGPQGAALGPVAAIMIGAVVCCAACIGGDNLQDLKCRLPRRRHAVAAAGHARDRRASSCALIMAPVLNLLLKAYGIGVPSAGAPAIR